MGRHLAALALFLAILPSQVHAAGEWAYGLFDSLDHDFGKVERGARLRHQFVISNRSEKEVRIKRVRVSCNCTQAHATSTRIGQGESTTIDAVMDTSGFQGPKSVTVYVQFDRPRRAEVALRVSCVSAGSLLTGNEVDFGVLNEGAGGERKLTIDYVGSTSWTATGIESSNPHIRAELAEISREGNRAKYEVKIELATNAPSGILEERLRIRTTDPKSPEIPVVVKAHVESKLTVSPETLRFSDLVAGQKLIKSVLVKGSKPFRVVRADNTQGMFEIRSSPDAKGLQLVEISLNVPENLSSISDHIELVTDLEGDRSVTVNIQR